MNATATRTHVLLDTRPARGKHRRRDRRAVRAALALAARSLAVAALLLCMLVGMMSTPTGTPTAAAATSLSTPCEHKSKGLRVLCNLPAIVAVTADAVTPR